MYMYPELFYLGSKWDLYKERIQVLEIQVISLKYFIVFSFITMFVDLIIFVRIVSYHLRIENVSLH